MTTTPVGTIKTDDTMILNLPTAGWRTHRVTFAGKTTLRLYDAERPTETLTLTPDGKPKGASYADTRFVSVSLIQKWSEELGLPWATETDMIALCKERNRVKEERDRQAREERKASEEAKRAAWAEEHKSLARSILPADWQSYFDKGTTLDRFLLSQPIPVNTQTRYGEVIQGSLTILIPHPRIANRDPEAGWWREWQTLEARCTFIGVVTKADGSVDPKDYSHHVRAEINMDEPDTMLIATGAMLYHLR